MTWRGQRHGQKFHHVQFLGGGEGHATPRGEEPGPLRRQTARRARRSASREGLGEAEQAVHASSGRGGVSDFGGLRATGLVSSCP